MIYIYDLKIFLFYFNSVFSYFILSSHGLAFILALIYINIYIYIYVYIYIYIQCTHTVFYLHTYFFNCIYILNSQR